MNWLHVLTILGGNVALTVTMFLWVRKEANADRKESQKDNQKSVDLIMSLTKDFHKETKDFHGRLIRLEERYIKLNFEK